MVSGLNIYMMGRQRALGVLCVLVLTWLGQVDQTEGSFSISFGPAGVWAAEPYGLIGYGEDSYNNSYGTAGDWVIIAGHLKQLDVGTNIVWGVNSNNNIFYRKGISPENPSGSNWERVDGGLKHVTVSPRGSVWGVASNDNIYYRQGASTQNPRGDSWVHVEGKLIQISAGGAGVWGVNAHNDVYYRLGTYGDTGGKGSGWTKVGTTKMFYVTSGDEQVLALNMTGRITSRNGMTSSNPTGTGWSYFGGGKKTVIDSYGNVVRSYGDQAGFGYDIIEPW